MMLIFRTSEILLTPIQAVKFNAAATKKLLMQKTKKDQECSTQVNMSRAEIPRQVQII